MATAPSKRAFQRLCFALLFNFPQLLYRPRAPTPLRPYSHSIQQVHEWHLTVSDQMLHFEATLMKSTHAIDRSLDMDSWATMNVNGVERVSFHANPHHSRLVQIWGGPARWAMARQNYKRHAGSARIATGAAQCAFSAAVDGALRSNMSFVARGLSAVKWTDISRLPGLNTYERQTVYRLKAGKLAAWNSRDNNCNCPHEGCSTTNPTLSQHTFWDCPEAKGLWTDIGCRWDRLGLFSTTSRAGNVYNLCIPHPPRLAWARCRERDTRNQLTEDHLDFVYETANTAWRYSCAAAVACVWRHRNAAVHGAALSHHGFRAASLQRIRCGLVNLQLSVRERRDKHTARIKADLLFHFTAILFGDCEQWPIERPRHTDSQYLLFFDGGSRGNPGPGGSGSIILRINRHQRQACILWVTSMAYSNRCTTNNMAEYMGLIHGLRFAQARKCGPLHVVGDSEMIIRQQRHHIVPKQQRLAARYRQTKRMADVMDISSWSHHYRAHNKMADLAANHAMDSSTSAQYDLPTTRWTGADIQRLMNNDIQHWFDQRQLLEIDYLFE